MKSRYHLVLVTAPNRATARKLARAALSEKVAACANLVPGIESHYWWQGRLESAKEVLVLFKTHASRLRALQRLVLAKHPYDTPEFVVLTLTSGNARYLRWISESVKGAAPSAV